LLHDPALGTGGFFLVCDAARHGRPSTLWIARA
jgi:hypothetical protein